MKTPASATPIKDPVRTITGNKPLSSPIVSELAQQLFPLIEQQPFFKGLSNGQLRVLADSAIGIQFKPEQWIFREGQPANRFYLILEGKVVLESEVKERGRIAIRTLGPGENLGWSWLFPPYYLHFSARAIEPVKTIFFYGTRLRQQCEENHELGYELMKRVAGVLIKNLDATQQRLMEATGVDYLPQ